MSTFTWHARVLSGEDITAEQRAFLELVESEINHSELEAKLRERYSHYVKRDHVATHDTAFIESIGPQLCTFEARESDPSQWDNVASNSDYFVFLMSHNVNSKTDSFVSCTKNPVRDVCLHNARKLGERSTASAAPHWRLDLVLGPFHLMEMARDCGQNLVLGSRGKRAKRKKAPFLAEIYNVGLYDSRVAWPEDELPFEQYLARHAPPVFQEMYCKLSQ